MGIVASNSEDDDMAAAIKASLEDQNRPIQESLEDQAPTSSKECSKADAKEVIKAFVDKNIHPNTDNHVNTIIINRKNVLSSTLTAIGRKNFSFHKEVLVIFSEEEGVDAGGPKRKYFRLLMLSLKNVGVFQGNWFSHDIKLLRRQKYELAGKLVAWSILHGGPGLKQLSHAAFCVLNDLPYATKDAITTVPEDKMKEILSALEKCTNDEQFDAFKESNADAIADYGYTSVYTSDLTMKGDFEHSLLKQSLVFSFHAEIEQFKQGLNSIGEFGDTVMSNAGVFKVVLPKDSNEKLSFLSMKKMIHVNYSESGSNNKEKEDKTMYCFDTFLQDLDEDEIEDLSLYDLLVFTTGADTITVMSNAGVFKVVLPKDSNEKLSFLSMKKMIHVNYSESGSNNKEKEDKTMHCFDTFLQDLDEDEIEDLSLHDLLVFTTGADTIPPLGFDDPITLDFYDQQEEIRRLP